MGTMTEKRRLIELRAELKIDQSELAQEAGVRQATISRMENGVPILERTALQVFYAYNRIRTARGMPELKFDDIAWTLRWVK